MNHIDIKVIKKKKTNLAESYPKENAKEVSIDDKKKLSNLFFYLQDVSQEIQSAFGIMQIVESTLDKSKLNKSVKFTEFNNTYTIEILKANPQIIKTMAKVAFQTTIIDICRISEAVNNSNTEDLLIQYCPISYERLKKFINTRYTNQVIKYRNKYAAHPINKDTNDFLSLKEIFALMEKILEIKTMNGLEFNDIFNFISELHHPDVNDPEKSITWAIHAMSIELKLNGIDVFREKPF